MKVKNILGFHFLLFFSLTSCNNTDTISDIDQKLDMKTEIEKVNYILKKYEEPSQKFDVPVNKSSKVKGKKATTIYINPADLMTESGQPLGEHIEVELKELINQEQLLRTNATTTSNGRLLVSGGAYFIRMTSNGQQLKLKNEKTLPVEFSKIADGDMYLFYGQRDTLGQLNWAKTEQKFEREKSGWHSPTIITSTDGKRDTIMEDYYFDDETTQIGDIVYKAVLIKQLGWINCDRFYNTPNTTILQYAFNNKDSIVCANVYLVFKDLNSVMGSYFFDFNKPAYNAGFENIPLGAKTQLIAISIKKGKTFAYKSDLIIKTNETVKLTLKEIDQDKLGELFQLN